MSARARTETPGPSAPGVADGTSDYPGDAAARLLGRVTVLPSLKVVACRRWSGAARPGAAWLAPPRSACYSARRRIWRRRTWLPGS